MSRTFKETVEYAERQLIDQDEVRLCRLLIKLVKRARQCDEPPAALAREVARQLHEQELA